jgi:hypothetical protein
MNLDFERIKRGSMRTGLDDAGIDRISVQSAFEFLFGSSADFSFGIRNE